MGSLELRLTAVLPEVRKVSPAAFLALIRYRGSHCVRSNDVQAAEGRVFNLEDLLLVHF
jgi:hypothetical protein